MKEKNGTTILLVDDDLIFSLDEKSALENYGYTVVTARSGEASILAVGENPEIDLVLMDINLGDGMDSTEAARRILEDHDIPIIFLLSHAEKEVIERTEKISSYGYVLKSAGITMVDSSIQMAFKLHHAYQAFQKLEQDLRDRENLLNATQELSKTGGWEFDLDTKVLEWTDETYRIHEIPQEEYPKGSSDLIERSLSCYHPEDKELVSEAFRGCCETGEAYDLEVRFTDTKGHDKWVRTIGRAVWSSGRVARIVGNIMDITERKEMEDSLRESERTFKRKLDALLSPEGDLGTLNLADVIDTESTQSLMDDFYKLTGIGVAVVDSDGTVLVATGWQDICTKFHRIHPVTRANCIESDTILGSGGETGTFKIYKCKNNMWDISTPILVGGRQLGSIFLGQFFFDNEEPDYETFRLQARRCGFDEQEYLEALDRVPRWSHETVGHVMDFYSRFAEVFSKLSYSNLKLARTLEEHKKAEEKIQTLLREKEIILNEVHHRIKNNLHTIESLFSIQISETNDPSVKNILIDAAGRVWSMMVLYDELYRSKRKEAISVREYLPPLVDGIIGIFPNSDQVHIATQLDDVMLSPKMLTPLGILINELLTNTMKYAFSEGAGGEISLIVRKKNGLISLQYEDEGPGIPEDVDLDSHPGFGLQLIKMLVKQMCGTVQIGTGRGARFVLEFPF